LFKHINHNPYNARIDEVATFSEKVFYQAIKDRNTSPLEIHNNAIQNYTYEYFDLKFNLSTSEVESTFEGAASSAMPTDGICDLLNYLNDTGIRTGVISNMCFSGQMLEERIKRYLPDHNFEFIISTSEYLYRKPDKRIFELALRKAHLKPSDVWYCGDQIAYDVNGAKNSGLRPVWYTGSIYTEIKEPIPKDCLHIKHWSELITLLKNE